MTSMPAVGVVRHGGRLREAAAVFPHAPTPWLDLSTGINPWPWKGERADWSELARLPDPVAIAELEAAAASAFGVGDPRRVLATAGAEAGLRLLSGLIDDPSVAIVSPTYRGHAEAWALARRDIREISPDQMDDAQEAVLVVVNPNNPDGRRIARPDLIAIAEARTGKGLWTVVDESFVEVSPELSIAADVIERLIVLRSFGKFHGLPGVRLGFMIAAPSAIERLRALQGDWPVSADAVVIGRQAYRDTAWRVSTRDRLAQAADALDQVLIAHGLTVIGGTSLFRLVETPRAQDLFQGLCERGVLTRPFEDAPDRLRIGLPGEGGLERLDAALRDLAP